MQSSPASLISRMLGHYRIIEQIGAGGMGVVYRAHDERLDRDVALKVLPPGTLADDSARRRFRKEALALSRLNHPNIATVHDFDTEDGIDFLVTEFIPGTTLDDKLTGGSLAEKEVIQIGLQLADGLQAAHRQGVVHRDLKPGNLRLTTDGRLKILDFGLATLQPLEDAATQSLTETGVGAGTLPYMAPEQLRGERADERSDLWATGVVLYELATGRRPFHGTTSAALADEILHAPGPFPQFLQPKLSARLAEIMLKCLEKDAENRYQSAKELLVDLRRLGRDSESGKTAVAPRIRPRGLGRYAVVAMVVVVLVAAAIYLPRGCSRPVPEQSQWTQLTDYADSVVNPALSADGRMVAFIRGASTMYGAGEVYVKMLPNGEPVQLTHDGQVKMDPQFSPDGSRIAYGVVGNWDSWTVPVLGGEARPMLPNATALTWIDDHHLLFSEIKSGAHMAIVTSDESRAGSRDVYVPPREAGMAHRSSLSADRKLVLLAEMDTSIWLPCRLVPFDGSSLGQQVGPPKAACYNVAWSPDGKWMYFVTNAGGRHHIWRQAFPDGTPQQVTSGATEEDGIAMAPDGRSLITSVGNMESTVWLHDNGKERQLSSEGFAYDPQFSSDGKLLYYRARHAQPDSGGDDSGELQVVDLATGQTGRLFQDFSIRSFSLSADGKRIVFSAKDKQGHFRLWVASLDLRFSPRQFPSNVDEDQAVFAFDGEVFFRAAEQGSNFLYRMNADGSGRTKALPQPIYGFHSISPDKKWVIVRLATNGEETPYVTEAFPLVGGAPVRICVVNCTARWAPGGRALVLSLSSMATTNTYLVPIPPGQLLPSLPAGGIKSKAEPENWKGAVTIPSPIGASPQPGVYAFRRISAHRNLYRIPLP